MSFIELLDEPLVTKQSIKNYIKKLEDYKDNLLVQFNKAPEPYKGYCNDYRAVQKKFKVIAQTVNFTELMSYDEKKIFFKIYDKMWKSKSEDKLLKRIKDFEEILKTGKPDSYASVFKDGKSHKLYDYKNGWDRHVKSYYRVKPKLMKIMQQKIEIKNEKNKLEELINNVRNEIKIYENKLETNVDKCV